MSFRRTAQLAKAFAVSVFALVCPIFGIPAKAALDMRFVDGAELGIDLVIASQVEACGDRPVWLWGATGWTDRSGSYLYFTYHGQCGRSVLFKRNPDGSYTDITPPNSDGNYTGTTNPNRITGVGLPTENRPIVADFNNDGYLDVISTGDETSGSSASMISTGPGVWDLHPQFKLLWSTYTSIVDLDGDGYLDARATRPSSRAENFGKGFVRTARNLAGEGFSLSQEPLLLPIGTPQEVVDRVNTASDRFHFSRVLPIGDEYIVTYGGAYQGRKWHYLIANGEVQNRGLPGNGTAIPPLRIGDSYAVPIQYGASSGVYRSGDDGQFSLDTSGDMPLVNEALKGGAYLDEFWAVDLDEDGDEDLVMSNLRNGFGFILENDEGTFRLHRRIDHVDGQAMSIADLDGDGDLDLVVAGKGDRLGAKRNGRDGTLYINQLRQPGDVSGDLRKGIPLQPNSEVPGFDLELPSNPTPGPGTPPAEPMPDPDLDLAPPPPARPGKGGGETPRLLNEASRRYLEETRSDGSEPGIPDNPAPLLPPPTPPSPPQPDPDPAPQPDPGPSPAPAPEPDSPGLVIQGGIPLPDHDPGSDAWSRWVAQVGDDGGRAQDHALISQATGEREHCETAIRKAQWIVDSDTVAGNQYLAAGRMFSGVFQTLAWCDVPNEQASAWAAWGRGHLGETDGSVGHRGAKIWWRNRWSRNNPANNYYHSFIVATTVYAMATNDEEWLAWLRDDRLPRMYNYYSRSPEGGSREGTGYGESHREVFRIAKMWRDYDGTEILPQEFIDNSIRYWTHAIAPGHRRLAPIGDQTRAKGKIDGYHCDILDNALQIAQDPDAIALGRWQLAKLPCFGSSVFRRLILRDYPETPQPADIPLVYFAEGAGVLFARDSWDENATFTFFTAGKRDEAHQHDDQGAFAVWADGRWQTIGDSIWTRNGIAQSVDFQNVVRFPSARNIRGRSGSLTWSKDCCRLSIQMDLSEVVGESWRRSIEWVLGDRQLVIVDLFDNPDAEFGFDIPGDDDQRAPYASDARATVERTPTGFDSVIAW